MERINPEGGPAAWLGSCTALFRAPPPSFFRRSGSRSLARRVSWTSEVPCPTGSTESAGAVLPQGRSSSAPSNIASPPASRHRSSPRSDRSLLHADRPARATHQACSLADGWPLGADDPLRPIDGSPRRPDRSPHCTGRSLIGPDHAHRPADRPPRRADYTPRPANHSLPRPGRSGRRARRPLRRPDGGPASPDRPMCRADHPLRRADR